ncbi:hypothetical protein FAZ69_28260 [Trinickia terrae]|uniref:Carboxymuconolactone decarboxylase family protein n=1 Tax=Trinickia terrae TaxID=2571161 RepID=A0A4U1HM60_9BURK|nr:hypothetical protein [Trinickia terrae]TKC81233.1 hypothetical protein FAZ69_28260 [Trinickia terrae]
MSTQTRLTSEQVYKAAPGVIAGLMAREKAPLAYTEAVTGALREGVSDELYREVAEQFPSEQIAFLTAAIANINAWNRIAIPFQYAPPIPGRKG